MEGQYIVDYQVAPIRSRQVGIVNTHTVPPTPSKTKVKATVARRYNGEKRDILDTVIGKAEELRISTIGACPVVPVENAWDKLTSFVVDVTPVIPLLPAEVVLR